MRAFGEDEIRRIRMLQFVNLDSIQGILDACTLRSLAPGEVLIVAGQQNRTVYFLLEGNLRIHRDSPESEPVACLEPGDSVGEASLIDHQPATASVVADGPVRLLAMEEEILWSLVRASHAAACNLLIGLSVHLRQANAVHAGPDDAAEDPRLYGTVDALTGLHNRHWMERALERQVQRSATDGLPLSLIMVSVDHFRSFNDQHGRAYGEHVLYTLANILSAQLRPTEMIARCDSDGFVVILPEVAIGKATEIAQRLHQGVMDSIPVTPDGSSLPHPTISIGLAALRDGDTGRELLAEAGWALSRARATGPNSISR